MPIITLTTDYGLRDPYAGQLKGAVLCACPSAQLVDITHDIATFDLIDAAYFISHTYAHYPVGTIHVCTVDNTYDSHKAFLCFERKGQTFILPDNGLAYLLWPEPSPRMVRLPVINDRGGASSKATISAALARLALGFGPHHLGPIITDAVQSMRPHPVTTPKYIRGSIVHIDRYENAVLNVHRSLVERMSKGREVHTFWSTSDPIVKIVDHYHEVPEGETLARYNSLGYVEIAINMGRAAQLLGLSRDQLVQLEFQGTV